ncbi:MAG TPA: tetratricopeptide repeat protein [Opitutaceae bacterium]|nr:tetratricopeptide repeat protein [Opitutaceae bacterium]
MNRKDLRTALAIAAVVLLAYLPTLRNGFVWDDDTMVAGNALVHAPDGLARMWATTRQPDYWPVSLSTFWVEWRLWGLDARGYHATNLALHLAEALLLWGVLRRLRVPGAALAAALFAVHPLNVESVAWITQRKNLMAMLFYLLSVGAFARWLGAGRPRAAAAGRWYALSLLAFALGMLSKGSVAMLPFVLLGLIAWRRRPAARDLLSLAPFLAVAAALVAVNLWFQTRGFQEAIRHAGPLERILGAGAVVWFYALKAVLPLNLAFVYPQWRIDPGSVLWWLPLLAALALTLLLALRARAGGRGSRWAAGLAAWLYFGVMLVPVLGLTDVYHMRYALVANAYPHLAMIGAAALAGAAWSGWSAPLPLKRAAAAAAVALLAALTFRETLNYRDAGTLFRATLARNPRAFLAYNGLGLEEEKAGRNPQAEADFRRAVELDPTFAEAYINLGASERTAGRMAAAEADLRRALRLNPGLPKGYFNLGAVELATGRLPEAAADFRRALQLDPAIAPAYLNLGSIELAEGQTAAARRDLEQAVRLDPAQAQGYLNLGAIAVAGGRPAEAVPLLQRALQLRPDYPQAYYYLGNAEQSLGRLPEAAAAFTEALRLQPNDSDVENYLGTVYAAMGRTAEALLHFRRALGLNPGNAEARANLAAAQRSE